MSEFTNKINYIFNGDCRDLLKQYRDEFFDCVVSDVPYKIITGGARISEESQEKFGKSDPKGIFNRSVCNDRLKSKWLKQNDADTALLISKGKLFEHCEIKFEEWLPEVYRVLKNGSHAYFMVNSRNLNELQTKAEAAGFKFLNLLVWVKNNYWTKRIFFSKASKDFKVCFCLGYPKKGDESRRLYGRILGIFCKKSGIKTDLKTTKPVIVIHFELTKEKK